MIRWRDDVDVLDQLARAGFTSYWIRKAGIMGQSELQRIRAGGLPSWKTLDWICETLAYDVGELLEHVSDDSTAHPQPGGDLGPAARAPAVAEKTCGDDVGKS